VTTNPYELQQDRRSFLEETAFSNEAGGFRHCLGEHTSNGEVAALRCVGRPRPPAQCEDLDAGESGLGIGQVLTLAASDVRDRPQHDGSRNRQFDRKRGQSERSSRSARRRREHPVQKLRIGLG
jgi:hypothetical protein